MLIHTGAEPSVLGLDNREGDSLNCKREV